jgi:hypothetical protein
VDSTAGNIDIDHTAVGAAVSVGALNTGGTGTINFDQTGAQALTITSSTTNDGHDHDHERRRESHRYLGDRR